MGLIKAGINASNTTFRDQWKEYFYCDSLPNNVLVSRGFKRNNNGTSNKGSDGIISNGSIVAVNEGQCMLIVDQGKVVEFCAEPGEYIYNKSSESSIFEGPLGKGIKDFFGTIGKRFVFSGMASKEQRVYFFNVKELLGNKFGTANPVPFRVVDRNIGLDMDISIRCHGEYSFKMKNPVLFYTNVCGNINEDYTVEQIESQLKAELMTALQPAFARISEMGVRYSALPAHTGEMATLLNKELSAKWDELRGINMVSIGISSIKASDEDETLIKGLQRSAVLRDKSMAAAHLVDAQGEAMKSAASNQSTGPFMAYGGMNMARQAGGSNINDLFEMADRERPKGQKIEITNNNDNYGWHCACGMNNTGKFCQDCGQPNPNTFKYRCDKCGWEPRKGDERPKFCPECGDRFDENDIAM